MAKMPLEHFTLIYTQLVLIRPELQRLPDLDEIALERKMHARIPALCRGSVVIKNTGSLLTPVDEDFQCSLSSPFERCLANSGGSSLNSGSYQSGKPPVFQRCILQQHGRHPHV